MADGYLLIGDVAINPDLVLDYARAKYNDLTAEVAARAGGAFEFLPASPDVKPGTDVNAPTLSMLGASSRYDLTSETDATATQAPDSSQRRMPVMSQVNGPWKFADAAIRGYKMSEDQIAAELGRQMAERIFNYRKLAMYYAVYGAAGVVTTHVETETDAFDAVDFLDAKASLGDASNGLTTVIMHSKQWYSLLKDVGNTANITGDRLGEMVFVRGGIPALAGMNIILDDQVLTASVSAGTQYSCMLLGPGALKLAPAPNSPLVTFDQGISIGRVTKLVTEDHFAVGVAGMDYDGGQSNPTTANLQAASNWGTAYSHDHREANWALFRTIET